MALTRVPIGLPAGSGSLLLCGYFSTISMAVTSASVSLGVIVLVLTNIQYMVRGHDSSILGESARRFFRHFL